MGELVLITGTSSGIGLAAAIACAREGHRVVATMRSPDRRSDLDAAIRAASVDVAIEYLDVTSAGVQGKVRELLLKYGPFYGLVNNAGIGVSGAFEEQTDEDVREQFETNVFGLMNVTRALLPSMRAARRGRIINLSSLVGKVGLPGVAAYAATKHAVEGFSESLRWEIEPFGIGVHLVEPGTLRTPLLLGNHRRGSLVNGEGPYAALYQLVDRVLNEEIERAPSAEVVGATIASLLGEAAPRFRTTVGKDALALLTLRRLIPDRMFASGVRFFSRYRGA